MFQNTFPSQFYYSFYFPLRFIYFQILVEFTYINIPFIRNMSMSKPITYIWFDFKSKISQISKFVVCFKTKETITIFLQLERTQFFLFVQAKMAAKTCRYCKMAMFLIEKLISNPDIICKRKCVISLCGHRPVGINTSHL